MNILAVSGDFAIGDMCGRLLREGHDVRVYIDEQKYTRSLKGRFEAVSDWRDHLEWVGKDGLILFDTTGFGKIQDDLRKQGYSVVGGSELGDRCEDDREYGQRILAKAGIKVLPSLTFPDVDSASAFIREHPKEWVIKHNGHASMTFNYVGEMPDGSDCLEMLETFRVHESLEGFGGILLQERVRGVEVGIGRYFNGDSWIGPVEINAEHKDLCDSGLGPKTWEMGTLMWFDDKEGRLFQETLGKLEGYLRSIGFRGDAELNCIVNERGIFPLEWTARFGFPALQLQSVLSDGVNWGEFLKAVADGKEYPFRYKKGYGIIVLVGVPPFPYEADLGKDSLCGTKVIFRESLTSEELERIHWEDVFVDEEGAFRIAGENGFVLHVSGVGETIESARENAYGLARKVVIPKMFYRTDIGKKFILEDEKKLKEWGWL